MRRKSKSNLVSAESHDPQWDLEYGETLWLYLGLADMGHILHLSEMKLAPEKDLQILTMSLLRLEKIGFKNLQSRAEIGDVYKNRENWLQKDCGTASGWLSFGRARREQTTVALHLCIQHRMLKLFIKHLDFVDILGKIAVRRARDLMPDYTYLQAAQPTSVGHYLMSFVAALSRDWSRMFECLERNREFPGGIGSTNGTALPIDRNRIANSLGFSKPVGNVRDAIWRTDLIFETATVCGAISLTLSRFSDDFLIWCTNEFGFVTPGGNAIRKSEVMPQKANPYILNMTRGILNRTLGQISSIAIMSRTPSNQIDNRIGAYSEIPRMISDVQVSLQNLSEFMLGLTFDFDRMKSVCSKRGIQAMDIAEMISLKTSLDYRTCHEIVAASLKNSKSDIDWIKRIQQRLEKQHKLKSVSHSSLNKLLNLDALLKARSSLGGASPESTIASWVELEARSKAYRSEVQALLMDTELSWQRLRTRASRFSCNSR